MFAKLTSAAITLISSVLFANFLPTDIYGNYRYVLSMFALLAIPTLRGIDIAVINAVAQGADSTYHDGLKTKLRYGTLSAIGSAILGGYYLINGNVNLGTVFLVAAPLLPIFEAFHLYIALLNGNKEYRKISTAETWSRLFSALCIISTALLTFNIILIIFAYLFSNVASRTFFTWKYTRLHKFSEKSDTSSIRYGKHISLTRALLTVSMHIDKVLVFHHFGAAQLAGYYLALLPYKQVRNLLGSLNNVAQPKFARLEMSFLQDKLLTKIMLLYTILIPITLVSYIVTPYLFKLLFNQYTNYAWYAQLFTLLILLYPPSLLQTAITAQNKKVELYLTTITPALVRVALLLVLLPIYGFAGLLWAIFLSHSFMALTYIFVFIRSRP